MKTLAAPSLLKQATGLTLVAGSLLLGMLPARATTQLPPATLDRQPAVEMAEEATLVAGASQEELLLTPLFYNNLLVVRASLGSKERYFVAKDPTNGQPYRIYHVSGGGSGNGTVKSPFGAIADALAIADPGDIIYVRSGTAGGFTIPTGVQVLSTAPVQMLDTQFGPMQLPESGSQQMPTITGQVIMNDTTVLAGFAVQPTATAISGIFALDADDLEIRDNRVENPTGQGISIGGLTGTLDVTITGNTVTGNDDDAINITFVNPLPILKSSATANIVIQNNVIENNGGAGGDIRGDGIKLALEENSVVASLLITGNEIRGNRDDGIDISLGVFESETGFEPSRARLTNSMISNNIIDTSTQGNGIILRSYGTASQMAIAVESNTITNSHLNGFKATAAGNGSLCLALSNNTSDNGYALEEFDSSTFRVVNRDTVATTNFPANTLTFSSSQSDFSNTTTCF